MLILIIIVVKDLVNCVILVIGFDVRFVIKVWIVIVSFGCVVNLNCIIKDVRLRGKIIGFLEVDVDIGVLFCNVLKMFCVVLDYKRFSLFGDCDFRYFE